ncbi:hypothetical protein ASL14_05375 [Paenibacillus sp. IHB B 3084]|nr:hypothetical protein ASL14_05375 [Paenibacillus sp. IHB B 3084]
MYNLTWLWAVINKQATTLSEHHFSVRATLEAVLDRNRSELKEVIFGNEEWYTLLLGKLM